MFHAPCVRGVGVVPSPIVLCAVSLHAGRAFHHARRARCAGLVAELSGGFPFAIAFMADR